MADTKDLSGKYVTTRVMFLAGRHLPPGSLVDLPHADAVLGLAQRTIQAAPPDVMPAEEPPAPPPPPVTPAAAPVASQAADTKSAKPDTGKK